MTEPDKALAKFKALKQKLSRLTNSRQTSQEKRGRANDDCHWRELDENDYEKRQKDRAEQSIKVAKNGKFNNNTYFIRIEQKENENQFNLNNISQSQNFRPKNKKANEKTSKLVKEDANKAAHLNQQRNTEEEVIKTAHKKIHGNRKRVDFQEDEFKGVDQKNHHRTRSGNILRSPKFINLDNCQKTKTTGIKSYPQTNEKKTQSLQNSHNRIFLQQFNDSNETIDLFKKNPETSKMKIVEEIDQLIKFKQEILQSLEDKIGLEKCVEISKRYDQNGGYEAKKKMSKRIKAPNLYQMQMEGRKYKSRSKSKQIFLKP